uniref:Uncharacterized protein n=1 Tax=Medicago truncatula TaxID=3880 RepID=A2Q657_MEDTR|nr:hypothetical protein MtrDRAFT_AC172744g3v1 [Medicago truncatula]
MRFYPYTLACTTVATFFATKLSYEHLIKKTFNTSSRSYPSLNRTLISLLGHERSPRDHSHQDRATTLKDAVALLPKTLKQ